MNFNFAPLRLCVTFLCILCVMPFLSHAQTEQKYIRDGNNAYSSKKYNDSEIKYRKSLEKNKESTTGVFNLGDALYKQGKYDEAADKFKQITGKDVDSK